MGLITLLVVVALTALYFSRSMDKKPPQLLRVTDIMTEHIEYANWVFLYGLVALFFTLLLHYDLGDMLIRIANNALICLMTLPFLFDKWTAKYHGKVNAAIIEEARNIVGWVSHNEKITSYIGAVLATVLFFMLFK
jgi:hypothetical protein